MSSRRGSSSAREHNALTSADSRCTLTTAQERQQQAGALIGSVSLAVGLLAGRLVLTYVGRASDRNIRIIRRSAGVAFDRETLFYQHGSQFDEVPAFVQRRWQLRPGHIAYPRHRRGLLVLATRKLSTS